MMMRCAAVLAAAACGAGVASADVIQVVASGAITSSNMSAFPVGQAMTITLTYESAGLPQSVQSRQAFYVDHFRSLHVVSGGFDRSHTGLFGQINKYDNLGNTDGIAFQAASAQGHYQFTNPRPQVAPLGTVASDNVTQTFGNMIVNFASNSGTVWSNYDLPTSYNFAQFDQTQNFNFGFNAGSFSGGFSNIVATNLSVPAPGAGALLGLGVATGLRRRRTGRA